jgi:transcriptional regulator
VHVPAVDRPLDDDEWRSFVVAQGFGHVVAAGAGRDVPVITPTQFVLDGDEVLAHVAAQNPILIALEERPHAVLAVAGDWAFVPSSWKAIAEEDPRLGIPTTYYAAVQLAGDVDVIEDPDALAAVLRRQLAVLQPDVDVADPALEQRRRLGAIRGLVLRVDRVEAKFKYGGNVDDAHRRAVLAHLVERGAPGDVAAAVHVRRRFDPEPAPTAFRLGDAPPRLTGSTGRS